MNQESDQLTDRFGAVASSLCAVHCALCALLPAAFAALGLGFLLSHEAEWLLTLVAVLFGGVALNLAWRTHRSSRVLGLLFLGVLGLLASRGIEMGSAHDDHGGGAEHAHAEHDGHGGPDEHHAKEAAMDAHHHAEDSEEGGHDDHGDDEALHVLGAGVGVFSGLLLFFGHLLNIRTARRCREDCCD